MLLIASMCLLQTITTGKKSQSLSELSSFRVGSLTSSVTPVPPVLVGEEWEDGVVEKLLARLKEPGSGLTKEVPGPPTHVDGELTYSSTK